MSEQLLEHDRQVFIRRQYALKPLDHSVAFGKHFQNENI